jgi:hypothetical protein
MLSYNTDTNTTTDCTNADASAATNATHAVSGTAAVVGTATLWRRMSSMCHHRISAVYMAYNTRIIAAAATVTAAYSNF